MLSFLMHHFIRSLLHQLLYALQYIFIEINTYLYDFQRVTNQIVLKRNTSISFKKNDGNAW